MATLSNTYNDSVILCNGIEISAQDERKYDCIVLENQLQVLLISDPHTEKSSAAMDVHVGHQSDPDNLPGLAHFLEHMLFLGTEKFPNENSYKEFLSAHSGRSNASTSQMHTNFYFDIQVDFFYEILQHFASFFICPLFTPSATEREMNAVHSENSKNLQNDHRRLYQLTKSLSNPKHPFSKFGTGNLETLKHKPLEEKVNVRQALIKFHQEFYSSSIMKLVLYGKEDVETLKKWAIELFNEIKNTGREYPKFNGEIPFDEPIRVGKMIKVTPVKDLRLIEIAWPLESLRNFDDSKPSSILSHLIGHEGKGSILSYLKANKWANGLSSGLMRDHEDWSMFCVKIEATEKGMKEHIEEIVEAVYEYLDMLRQKLNLQEEERIFQETQNISFMDFRFKNKETPINYTSSLAGRMHRFPRQKIISGNFLVEKNEPKKVFELLHTKFLPKRMRLTLVSKQFEQETKCIEKWYQTPYLETKIDQELIHKWTVTKEDSDFFHLPAPNEFIPSDFHSVFRLTSLNSSSSSSSTLPSAPVELINQDEKSRVWYQAGTKFQKPKLNCCFCFYSPRVSSNAMEAVLTSLFVRFVKDELTEFTYDAELAGMSFGFAFNQRAIELSVNGYHHKLPVLLNKILHTMRHVFDKINHKKQLEQFERIKEQLKRQYTNFFLEEPYQHGLYFCHWILEVPKYSVEEKIKAIELIEFQDLFIHSKQIFYQLFTEAFFHGNILKQNALEMMKQIVFEEEDRLTISLPLMQSQDVKPRLVALELSTEYLYQIQNKWNSKNKNSAICTMFQFEMESLTQRARNDLFGQLLKEPCFHQLRTKEQLGYLVFSSSVRFLNGIEGFRIIIQSDHACPLFLDSRIEIFLKQFRQQLVEMSFKQFQKHVQALVTCLKEKPKKEWEECYRSWQEISNETYFFQRRQQIATIVETLQLNDMIEFFDTFIDINAPKRRKLTCHIYGNAHSVPLLQKDSTTATTTDQQLASIYASMSLGTTQPQQERRVYIEDVDAFKRSMPLHPERSSHLVVSSKFTTGTGTGTAKL